jgi:hypothetical protein
MNGILKNDRLTHIEKEDAAARFIHRIFFKTKRRSLLEKRIPSQMIDEIFSKDYVQKSKRVSVRGTPTALRTPFAFGFLEETETTEEGVPADGNILELIDRCFQRHLESLSTTQKLAMFGLTVLN